MTYSRYESRRKKKNTQEMYEKHFEKRDVEEINHYTTPKFDYQLLNENPDFEIKYHIWKDGDRLSKLAEIYYKNPTLWWIISYINQKPTESHFTVGETIMIPYPPGKVIEFMGL